MGRLPLLPLLAVLITPLPLAAQGMQPGGQPQLQETPEDDEIEARYLQRRRERAAEYRIARLSALDRIDETYHARAVGLLEEGRAALGALRVRRARKLLQAGLERYPFSHSAPALTHELLRSYLLTGDLRRARLHLIDLHERFPSYDGFQLATVEALEVAEYVQRRGDLFDFSAEDPEDFIQYRAGGELDAADYLFHFLSHHGDRRLIGPRATLGIARSQLLKAGSSEERLVVARLAYDRFLDTYPEHPLVFEALIEQATSYLLSYRGDKFDTGVLIKAQDLIDQAELYIDNIPERADIVRRFRALIRRWRQERDLSIARWYRARDRDESAIYYYTEVIARDAASPAADAARRERSELVATGTGLGEAVEAP